MPQKLFQVASGKKKHIQEFRLKYLSRRDIYDHGQQKQTFRAR